MNAGQFVGRVGLLAIGLGVGAAVFGSAQAWADEPSSESPSTATTVKASTQTGVSAGPAKRGRPMDRRGRAAQIGPAGIAGPERPLSAARVSSNQRPSTPAATASSTTAATGLFEAIESSNIATAAASDVKPPAEPIPAAAEAAPPTASVAEAGLPASSRRTADSSLQQPANTTAAATASASITGNPTVVWDDGVFVANAGVTSDLPLAYSVYRRPDAGGALGVGPFLPLTNFAANGDFNYLPYATALTDPNATESFKIMAFELTAFDQAIADLLGAPGPALVQQTLAVIHRIPIVGWLLSPLIGRSTIVDFTVNPYQLAAGRPSNFTYMMPSFDGTGISVNYFPAVDVANGTTPSAPTVLSGSGLAVPASTDPNNVFVQLLPSEQFGSLAPGIKPLRTGSFQSSSPDGPSYDSGGGYNVITWDPRGEYKSEGQLQIDNPFFEGRDVSSIISWLTGSTNPAQDQVLTDIAGDPLVAMTGGSYGGGIQFATVDPRIDAIVPQIAWNSMLSSLYPDGAFKTGFGTVLAGALAGIGARVNPEIYLGILTGVLTGYLTPTQQAVLGSVGPTSLLTKELAPTLQFQGIHDTLFLLQESVETGQTITEYTDTPYKLVWFCGGHGPCSIPNKPLGQGDLGIVQNLQWLDQYLAGDPLLPADAIPDFQWYDQLGMYYSSDLLPFEDGFNPLPSVTATGPGGFLGLGPLIGGSNPKTGLPLSLIAAGKAWNALNVAASPAVGSQIVGAPTLSFSYTGLGTSRTVYAQLVDDQTGLVLGNNSTPIPVVLDGRSRTVEIPMANIAYTAAGHPLTLQITSSALNYENFTTFGLIDISDIKLELPVHAIV